MNVTERIADLVTATRYEDLPSNVIDLAKPLILDSLAVSIAGTQCTLGQLTLKVGSESMRGDDATVIGGDYKSSVSAAAYINGTLAHALDVDDTAAGTVAHPSSSIVPALFAVAEKYQLSGKAFLNAYIIGLEVFYRIARASNGQMRGWHRTSLFGALATATAIAKLLNLSSQQIQTAIGIAMSFTGGVQVNFGTMTKAVQVGHASQSGVMAAMMAMEGCTAHQNVLGDTLGFGHTFYADEYVTDKITAEFASPYSIIYPGMAVKIYPCCGLTHCPVDIALDLVATHDIQPDQVEDIVVYTEELVPSVLIHHEPKTGYQGKYSLEYAVAAAIFDRNINFDTFTDDAVNRPQLQAFLGKIRCKVRPDSDWEPTRIHAWNHCAEITIRLNDGTKVTASQPCARGYPDRPLSTEDIVDKYQQFASPVLAVDAIDALGDKTLKLEEQENIADVIGLTRGYSK